MASHAIRLLIDLLRLVRSNQLQMAHVQCGGQFIQRHDGRVPPAPFQAADVLLTEAGKRRELLLCQAFLLPDSPHVSAHQFAHVHAQWLDDYTL